MSNDHLSMLPRQFWTSKELGIIRGDDPKQPPLFRMSGNSTLSWKDNYGQLQEKGREEA